MPHFFVDISSHGFGHLAQTAPILNALQRRLPTLRLTIRSGLPQQRLAGRIGAPFTHLPMTSDFGFQMHDPLRIDRPASAARYRAAHADWSRTVDKEAALLRRLAVDFVLSNVSYLPLAGAAQAGIPAAACCSLNWADLFAHFFAGEEWAPAIERQIAAAYRSAPFLALQPAMPMPCLADRLDIPPVASPGGNRRQLLAQRLPVLRGKRVVLLGFGGIAPQQMRLDVGRWARRARQQGLPPIAWLLPAGWALDDPDCLAAEASGLGFSDLLASCDAVLSKPGYGTFVEAACVGVPVLWLRREDWPEQDCLVDWLEKHAAARQLLPPELLAGTVPDALQALWRQTRPARPEADGAARVADWLLAHCG